ncbi:3-ketoacyl- reductase [Drechmeria coniospora]|uniref:3-ketoacyl-reductase n=1 Tax=Drechmeria coniospora TaxID=98403 RepID=A0A151GDY7_DRECN|nr:3-ketoacyl- reductase [Drechmeria coniospora]KYK55293.1 3-ketoacyl- reductase [Drechmeria coniospora]
MSSLRLAGKHCAVVGATGILGRHIAKAFASNGAVVSLLGRTAVASRHELERDLVTYTPSSSPDAEIPTAHRFIRLDVADPAAIRTVFAGNTGRGSAPASMAESDAAAKPTDLASVGSLDVLVNCAGISQTTLLRRTSDPELASILDTNLLATMLVCKYAKVRPGGCIINIASLMATKGGLGATAYAASKAGVVGFTRALCREMSARSIRVNALLPGWVQSPMWDREYTSRDDFAPSFRRHHEHLPTPNPLLPFADILSRHPSELKAELKEAHLRDTPLHRVADPAEVADAAIFLAANGFANNCVLNLDGGLSAA